MLANVPGAKSSEFSCNRDTPRPRGVFELPVAAARCDEPPAVTFDKRNRVFDFGGHGLVSPGAAPRLPRLRPFADFPQLQRGAGAARKRAVAARESEAAIGREGHRLNLAGKAREAAKLAARANGHNGHGSNRHRARGEAKQLLRPCQATCAGKP